MHLDHRRGDRLDRVEQGDGCVGQCAGVEDDRLRLVSRSFVQPVDQMALMVALANGSMII